MKKVKEININLFIQWITYILVLTLVSCKGGSGGKFESLDNSTPDAVVNPIHVAINTYTPNIDPINLPSNSTTTFGVTLTESDSSVNYTFLLDNSIALQSGADPFYNLSTSGMTAGSHTLKVTATNLISTDQHTFNIIVNSPTVITSFNPNLTGTNIACSFGNSTMSAYYSEPNNTDTVNIKWYINNTQVAPGNVNGTATNDPGNNTAMFTYHPDCTQTGINFIRVDLNDGHEITSQTWTVSVTAPITMVIASTIPSTDPTILTGSTTSTFGVTLATPDSTANYLFVLDGATTLQNNHQNYYSIAGSSLTIGTHTLQVTASNTNSTASHTFTIRRNSQPVATGYSPALSGTTVNCGTSAITLYADMFDANGDTLSYTWYVDDAPSVHLTPTNAGNRAQASFSPNCALAGSRVVKVVVSDGYETQTVTWSITIATPIAINITSFLPATNPTILTNSQTTTFAVALSSSDQNVTYSFILKNLNTNATSTLQSGTVPFYNLVGSTLAAGLFELKVSATNGTSTAEHLFTVRKNSPPAVPPTPLTYSPPLTGTTLNCGSSSQLFQSYVSDADNDIMAITWYLDGVGNVANLVNTSTQTEVKGTYTPTCAEVGVKNIRVDVYDGYETTSKTWTVSVVNPTIVSINSYAPATDPVYVLSTGSQIFNISATGKAPLVYEWKLDGAVLASSTSDFTTITAGSLTTGVHTLVVKVNDADSNQSKTFNIIKNAPPVLAGITPTSTTPKVNINTVINFSANFSDANSDAMTVTWKLNGSVVSNGNANASISTVGSATTLTFTPTAARIGDNTIALVVSDGKETTTQTWTLNINYFSDICNNLGAGKVCTIAGRPGRGSNVNPTTSPTSVMIRPHFIANYGATTSYFVSDDLTHSVWFYNKTAGTVNILGQSIGAGKVKAVMGVGQSGVGTTGTSWNDFPLSSPRGVAWDTVNQRLFVTDEGNGRIVMLDSTGTVTVVMTNTGSNIATYNGNGTTIPTTLAYNGTWCSAPRGIAYDSANSKLYVACYSSSTVKVIDTSNANSALWTASILSGYNAATAGIIVSGSGDGVNNYTGSTNGFQNPMTLKLDTTNNILYVVDAGHCKVKAINLTGSAKSSYFYGAITLPANATVTVAGINSLTTTACTTYTTGGYATARYNSSGSWNQVEVNLNGGGALQGIFVSDWGGHRITYLNNTASSVVLGNATIAGYSMNTIWNPNATGSYFMPCTSASSATCYLYNPSGMYVYNNKLYVADYNNYRIRSLDISATNGAVADDLGYDRKPGFAGNGGTSTENIQFNTPLNLYFDQNSGKLLVSDFYNYRIRALNLNTGRIDSFISNGQGNANNSNVDPTVLGMQGPRGVVNYQNHIIFGDNQSSNCLVRAWNTMASVQTIFGVSVFANAVQTIAGNWANGCGAWNPSVLLGNDANAKLYNPQGVTTDGTNLYFANTQTHCIIKLDVNGNMTPLSGLCGTSGTANGAGIAFSNSSVRFYFPTAVVVDPRAPYNTAGNLFILDQTSNAAATKIRYINQYSSAVTIYGVTINPGEIKTIYTAPDGHGADLASFDNQICYSTGGDFNYNSNASSSTAYHTVICFNRDDTTGTNYTRFGRNPSVYVAHGYQQEDQEEEGIAATSMSFASPAGMAFDSNGNLYIAERDGHDIRMVKKWW